MEFKEELLRDGSTCSVPSFSAFRRGFEQAKKDLGVSIVQHVSVAIVVCRFRSDVKHAHFVIQEKRVQEPGGISHGLYPFAIVCPTPSKSSHLGCPF